MRGFKAKETAAIGSLTHEHQTATTAGIRQEVFVNQISKQVNNWNRNALKSLTYVTTDRGPLKACLHKIGRAADDKCTCGEPQNAVHILRCPEVADGKGRIVKEKVKAGNEIGDGGV